MKSIILDEFSKHIEVCSKTMEAISGLIEITAKICINSLKNGNKILLIGNGGSAADAQHIAAEIIGVPPLKTKLSAFAISSFYIGVAGALYFAVFLGAIEVTESFDIMTISFPVLFMIIIGGLGSMLGSFLGAGFIVTLPIGLKFIMVDLVGLSAVTAKHFEITIWGLLMIIFLIVEPHGLARLWSIAKEKLRRWPFPY